MMTVVPDASVILKWVLGAEEGPDANDALRILDAFLGGQIELRLPSLWRYEVGNILGMRRPGVARETMEALLGYRFEEEHLHAEYCLDVLRFVTATKGVSFYDAAYHVLALRASGVYVTADQRYIRQAGRRGRAILLSEWAPPPA
jgi:predicted nucleic acid-binding protein